MERKSGAVNEIIYDNTSYCNGKYRFYLPICDLVFLINQIISCGETTKYVRFTPFFRNHKKSEAELRNIEFDEYMCFIECKADVDVNMYNDFINECKEKFESFAEAQKHYCLCDHNDIAGFHKALKNYVLYLDEIIPKLIIILKSEYKFKDEDLQFGYFCFEVHSE